ncbi:TetR/AcrR family transcriptional regulator [Nocardioides fonticola]|uniref:TetR/AcrR family transcriptional regulator n=1 Tax=Nocardioides fonticola TaxID=450363 RepID=A0ABP7XRL9_9ACTN
MTTRPLTTRERIVDAGVQLTTDLGWSRVTMAKLADAVGVSRQTVHNEVGTKAGLAEAMILRELERFMTVVDHAFDTHPTDLVAAIRASAEDVLVHAGDNTLLKAVVSATHGADTELLPLLTTHAHSLLTTAKEVIAARVEPYEHPLTAEQTDAMIDIVVRVVLSHVMQPSAAPTQTADAVAFIAARVLAGEPDAN